ncbi:MAG: O-antigen ligase family protein [Bacteroidia bacterium]|nr:O-antigen ligase family protein [Bacteroidia bacterium]
MLPEANTGIKKSDLWVGVSIILLLIWYNINLMHRYSEYNQILLFFVFLIFLSYLLLNKREQLYYLLVFTIPLSVTFPINESSTLNGPSELICALLGLYFLLAYLNGKALRKDLLKHPISILLLLDLLWMLITSFSSQMPEVSVKRWIIRSVYLCVYYFMFAEFFLQNKTKIPKVFVYYCLGLILPIVYYLYQHQKIGFAIQGSTAFSRPFYNDHTVYGAALVFFLPFLYYYTYRSIQNFNYRLFYILLAALILVASFFSYSRAAWLSLLCAFGVYLIFKWKIKSRTILTGILAVAMVGVFFSGSVIDYFSRSKVKSHGGDVSQHFKSVTNISTDASNVERINRWKCAWRMFKDKPMAGFGPGTYQFFYGQFQVSSDLNYHSTYAGNKGHAHSEYLNYLSETGLPGLLIFIMIMVFVGKTAANLIRKSYADKSTSHLVMVLYMGLITFYIHSFFNGFIESDKMAMPVFASIAAIVAIDLNSRASAQEIQGRSMLKY